MFVDPSGLDIEYGYATSKYSEHQQIRIGTYAQSFGPTENASLWDKITDSGPSELNKTNGDGIVYDNSSAPMTEIILSLTTTPEEDKWLQKELKKEAVMKRDYCVGKYDCRNYSFSAYLKLAILLNKKRSGDSKCKEK